MKALLPIELEHFNDHDLAVLYGAETRVLNQAVRRNADRFPSDLMFQVEASEVVDAVSRTSSD